MRAVTLSAALLASAIVLLGPSATRAQEGSYPGAVLGAGAAGDSRGAPAACGRDAPAPEAASSSGLPVCRAERTGVAASGNRGCLSASAGSSGVSYGPGWRLDRYATAQGSPFYAPGGEAYSYAGYGGAYSPYAGVAGTSTVDAGSASRGGVASSGMPSCVGPTDTPPQTRSAARLSAADLASLALPATTRLQRSTDLRDPDVWLIQTREGPMVGRVQSDGGRVFFPAPPSTSGGTAWRPWTGLDRPAADRIWQQFAAWWIDQGYAWPPS